MATLHRPSTSRFDVRLLSLFTLFCLTLPLAAAAQGSGGLGTAILALRRTLGPNQVVITGRLYGGDISSTIDNGDDNRENFTDADFMRRFVVTSADGLRGLTFPGGNRTAFNDWVRENASDLLGILFPTSISAGVSGRDAAQLHSQEFLLTQALNIHVPRSGERTSGGLFEYERYERDDSLSGDTGGAWRGFYRFDGLHLSVDGRFANQRSDTFSTRATTVGLTFHPSRVVNEAADWRIGATARSSVLFSQSDAMTLGTLDLAGGVWTAARKDFARVRVAAGTVLQGSRTIVPGAFIGDDFDFVADAINERKIAYDITYGTVLGYALTDRFSLNTKILETRAIAPEFVRPASRLVLAGVSYLAGGITPVDVGYKVATGGGLNAHAVYVQGNFGW